MEKNYKKKSFFQVKKKQKHIHTLGVIVFKFVALLFPTQHMK
jgi:hypothetical protein